MHFNDIETRETQTISNFFVKFFVQPYDTQTVTNVFGHPYEIKNYEIFSRIRFSDSDL